MYTNPNAVEAYQAKEKTLEEKRRFWAVEPKDMKKPANIRISADRLGPKTSGFHLCSDVPGGRKILPGEVVTVDLEWPAVKRGLHPEHGSIETTVLPATRPLVYTDPSTAEYASPGLRLDRIRGNEEQVERARTRAREHAERLSKQLDEIGGAAKGHTDVMTEAMQEELQKHAPRPISKAWARKFDPRDELAAHPDDVTDFSRNATRGKSGRLKT